MPLWNTAVSSEPTKASSSVPGQESLANPQDLSSPNFHRSHSFPDILPRSEQQISILSGVSPSVCQCTPYNEMENLTDVHHSKSDALSYQAASPNGRSMGCSSGSIVTNTQIAQVVGAKEATSSLQCDHSASSCIPIPSGIGDHPLDFSKAEIPKDQSSNSNNNNYKEAMPGEIFRAQSALNFDEFGSRDSNTNSSAFPSIKNVITEHNELPNGSTIKDLSERTHVDTDNRNAWNDPKEEQCHYKAAQSVVESSSQTKGQQMVNEISSSSEYEPNSTEDDSDDSDQYVRRRLVEINAKFAQEPFPPDGDKIRETKVTFKEQLVDFGAPPIDSSVTEPSDATIEWIEACGEVAVNCSSILHQPVSQPVVQELSLHLQNVQVDEPLVRRTHSVKSEDFREPMETRSQSCVIPSVKKEKAKSDSMERVTISRPNTAAITVHSRISGSESVQIGCKVEKKRLGVIQSNAFSPRPRSTWAGKFLDDGDPRLIAVKTWIEEKNRILRARHRAQMEQQMREEEEKRRKQALDRELREKHWSAWLKNKSKQCREERELKQRQEAERTYFTVRHTKSECDRAFHEWLRRKAAEQQQQLQEVRRSLRTTRQAMRNYRTTQKWTRVIDQAKIYKLI